MIGLEKPRENEYDGPIKCHDYSRAQGIWKILKESKLKSSFTMTAFSIIQFMVLTYTDIIGSVNEQSSRQIVHARKMNICKNLTEPTDMKSIHLPMNWKRERCEFMIMPEPVETERLY